MGFPAFLKANLITSSVSISSSTEDANYPHEYLFDTIAALPFRFTVTVTGATMALKAGAAPAPSTLIATPVYREGNLYATFNPPALRYWRLEVDGSWIEFDFLAPVQPTMLAIINHNFLVSGVRTEIGELSMGTHIALPAVRRPGNHSPAVRENKITHETERGVKWIYDLFRREERNYLFRLRTSQLGAFRDFHDAVGGSASPFVFVPDLDSAEVFYVRKEESFEPDELEALPAGGGMVFDYMLRLTEESHGAAVAA